MKRTISYLSLLTVALTVGVQAANAQPAERQARFKFAPNIYRTEEARMPVDNTPEPFHNVRNGAVPRSTNFLGVDPSMTAPRPAPPPPVQTVAARPVTTTATPQMFVPKTSFNPAFGKPTHIAQLPAPVPQQAVAQPMTMPVRPAAANHAPAAVRRAPVAKRHYNSQVAGRLLTPVRTAPVNATPEVASYGKNVGYIPGPILPSTNIGNINAQSEVRGKIIRKK